MRKLRILWNRYRAWRLHRWADDLQREADIHKKAATLHSSSASQYFMKASDVRSLARRVQAAGF